MSRRALLQSYLKDCPLIGIIRGVRPEEAVGIGQALFDAGLRVIEVPLNSPEPLHSIERLAQRFGEQALIGAGTVLNVGAVSRVADAGGRLIVSPNSDTRVIAASVAAGLVSIPGFFTPTEGFAAIAAGADALKLFPAEAASPRMLQSMRAVLPPTTPVLVVGGVKPGDVTAWRAAGADGFGLGGSLYRAGDTAAEVGARARDFVAGLASGG